MNSGNPLKKEFIALERNVLILIMIPLSLFSLAYLYTTAPERPFHLELPVMPDLLGYVLLSGALALLVWQAVDFQKSVKNISKSQADISVRLRAYTGATLRRFWQLLLIGIFSTAGLLLFQNPGFTVIYAAGLVFVSLGKPTPERIIRGLRLKGEEKEMVYDFKRRDP